MEAWDGDVQFHKAQDNWKACVRGYDWTPWFPAMSEAEYRFIFPLPPDELRVNFRQGRSYKSVQAAKAAYRLACEFIVQSWKAQPDYRAFNPVSSGFLTVTAYLGSRQRCDPSDLGSWAKVPIDALVKIKVLRSDSAAIVQSFTALVKRDSRNPRLEIRLRRNSE